MDRSYRGGPPDEPDAPGQVRRRLLRDGAAIALSAAAFAIVYGLAARQAGLSLMEGTAMSVIVFAGAAQFAAVGLLAQGVPWLGIVVLTGLLNARHLLYSASLAPWFAGRPRRERAGAAFLLTDEAYALAMPAFQALRRYDAGTYRIAAMMTFIPWVGCTIVGMIGGDLLPSPASLGLDVIFPAAMAGLSVALIVDRRALVAAVVGGALGVGVALVAGTAVGIVIGGLAGPGVALLVRESPERIAAAETTDAGAEGLP